MKILFLPDYTGVMWLKQSSSLYSIRSNKMKKPQVISTTFLSSENAFSKRLYLYWLPVYMKLYTNDS